MRLLLDESVPATLRRHLPLHEVQTVVGAGWQGVKNGPLWRIVSVDSRRGYQPPQGSGLFEEMVSEAENICAG